MRGSRSSGARPRSAANASASAACARSHVAVLVGAQPLVGVDHRAARAHARRRGPRRPRPSSGIQARSASAAVSPGGRDAQPRAERGDPLVGVGEREVLLGREVARDGAGGDVGGVGDLRRSSSRGSPGGRTARARRPRSPAASARRLRSRRPVGGSSMSLRSIIVADIANLQALQYWRARATTPAGAMSHLLARARPHPHPALEAQPRRRRDRRSSCSAPPPAPAARPPTTSTSRAPSPRRRSTSSRRTAPRFAGADSTLVFSVAGRQGHRPGPAGRDRGRAGQGPARSTASRRSPTRSPRAARSRATAASPPSTSATRPTRPTSRRPTARRCSTAAETAERDGVEVAARGILIDLASEQDAPVGELIGVGIAIILLTLLFRSLAAMAATLVGALIGVMVGQILLAALAAPLDLPAFAAVIAVMLGLGAGIDYSLLIIGRYREQVAAGDSPRDASAKSAATSGASVVAAGLIVMVAIAGLLVIGIPFIGKLGIAAAIGVGAVVVSALDDPADHDRRARAAGCSPKKPEHVRPSRGVRALGRARHRAAVAVDRRRRARPARLRRAGHAAAPRPARRRQPARGQDPARRLRPAQRGVRPRLQRPVPARGRHPEGRARTTRRSSPSSRRRVADTPGIASVAPAAVSQDGEMATIFAIPTHRAAGRDDERPARAPARGRDPGRDRRHAAEGLRRRQHGRLRGLLGQGRLAPAAVHRAS